jgi:hypothetical protein
MQIHYSRGYINTMMLLGGLGVVSGLGFLVIRSPLWFQLPIGAFLLIGAISAQNRPYFTIEQDKLVLHSFIGPLTRTFAFGSQQDITVEGNSLYLNQNGKRTKIPVSKSITEPGDWASLEASYGQK